MIVAIDTGGTKTLITTFDKNGAIGQQIKYPTPQEPNEYVDQTRKFLENNFANLSVRAIVIAVPGTLDDKNRIIWCPNLPKWKGFDVVEALKGCLKNAPIFIENDAKLAGLYESRVVQDTIPDQLLYVTISTGIGTAIIINGHIIEGINDSEAGRALIEYDGQLQEWQKFSSGKAFYETYGKYVSDIDDEDILRDMAHRMSLGFLEIIPTLQPDVIVIGGSVGTYFDKYIGFLHEILTEKLAPTMIPCPKFYQAINSEQAVIYGCYYYALDNKIIIEP